MACATDRTLHNSQWSLFINEIDNSTAITRAPVKKGHKAIVYLSYIIDHRGDLQEIAILMRVHTFARHNNDLLNHDSSDMVSRLQELREPTIWIDSRSARK